MSKESSQNLPEGAHKMPEDTRQTSDNARQISENSAEIPSEHSDIFDFLWEGQKSTKEIANHLSVHESTARKHLAELRKQGKIEEVKKGHHRLSEALAPWTERKNEKIIDSLMKLYEKILDRHLQKEDISLNDFKGLVLMVDRLMKRWYLVHRGYDSNTKQAHEDAKQKTVERKKTEMENAPPEDQVVVIREYDETMRDVLAKLPGKELKKRTV